MRKNQVVSYFKKRLGLEQGKDACTYDFHPTLAVRALASAVSNSIKGMFIGKVKLHLQTIIKIRKSQGIFKNTTRHSKRVYQNHKIKSKYKNELYFYTTNDLEWKIMVLQFTIDKKHENVRLMQWNAQNIAERKPN